MSVGCGKHGPRPPKSREWETGKTVASILFVHEAEEILDDDHSGLNVTQYAALQRRVQELKDGRIELVNREPVQQYLDSL